MRVKKYSKNPILIPSFKGNSFENLCVYNPGATIKDGKVCLLYRAEAKYENYISRIGLALVLL